MTHFEIEAQYARKLIECLERPVARYRDPNAEAGRETGADVLIELTDGRRIGVQVTRIDTGEHPGESAAAERSLARGAENQSNGVYANWAQNDPRKTIAAIARSVARKADIAAKHKTESALFDELWLLMCSGAPESGLIGATLAITTWLDARALDAATSHHLSRSDYKCAFLLPVLNVERVLYTWENGGSWEKIVKPEPAWMTGPSIFDVIAPGSEWLADPEGTCDREIAKCLAEFRSR
jgi:hypothetical protein